MDVETIRSGISPILKSHHAKKAILFGSYARSTEDNRSDIDLIIVDDEELPCLERLEKYFKDLTDVLAMSVDLFVYRSREFEEMKEGPFVGRAIAEGVTLYER